MTYASRVDANQSEVVMALRKLGATVQPLHIVGKGCPDLLVGYRGRCYLFEVKDGNKTPSERKLTEEQWRWHRNWRGQVAIVETSIEAVDTLIRLSRLAA